MKPILAVRPYSGSHWHAETWKQHNDEGRGVAAEKGSMSPHGACHVMDSGAWTTREPWSTSDMHNFCRSRSENELSGDSFVPATSHPSITSFLI